MPWILWNWTWISCNFPINNLIIMFLSLKTLGGWNKTRDLIVCLRILYRNLQSAILKVNCSSEYFGFLASVNSLSRVSSFSMNLHWSEVSILNLFQWRLRSIPFYVFFSKTFILHLVLMTSSSYLTLLRPTFLNL